LSPPNSPWTFQEAGSLLEGLEGVTAFVADILEDGIA